MEETLLIGDACLDIDVYVGEKIVEQREVRRIEVVPGGSGGNMAYVASMGSTKTTFVTSVGKDPQALLLRNLISERYPNLNTVYLQSVTGETCTVINIINRMGARRTYFRLKPVFPNGFWKALPGSPSILCFSGYSMELVSLEDVVSIFDRGYSTRIFALYPRAPLMRDHLFKAVFPRTDILVGNLREYERLYDIKGYSRLVERLMGDDRPRVKIVTLGSKGAVLIKDRKIFRAKASRPSKIKSLKGAGDSFVGGLASLLASGLELEEAVSKANSVASAWISGELDRIPYILEGRR